MQKYKKTVGVMLAMTTILIGLHSIGWFNGNPVHGESEVAKCEYHQIDINLCSRCNPELIPEFKAQGDWCAEHNLPESQCDLCDYGEAHGTHDGHDHDGHDHEGHAHEDFAAASLDIHDHEEELPGLEMDMPGDGYKSEFLVFFPENKIECATDGAVIQLASIKTAERTGLTVRSAVAVESSPLIEAPAQIVFDESKTKVLSTTIPVLITQWLAEPGQRVVAGEPLAILTSPALPEMKANYLEAHASWILAKNRFDRQKELFEGGLISDSEFEDSEAEFAVADAHLAGQAGLLLSAGLSANDLDVIINDKIINQSLMLYAAEDGVIIERIGMLGELLDEGSPLAVVGDPGALWIEAQVREGDVSNIDLGDEVVFSSDGSGLRRCSGEVIWIAQYLDRQTRSLTVRAKIKKGPNLPHSGEFGRVIVNSGNKSETVMVPKDAIQWEGCCNVVFVRESIDRFRPRKVRIEPGEKGYYRVVEGLNPGEDVVVNGSYLMKTELRKGSIGAGCCGL